MKRMKHLLVLCLALVMVVGLLSVTALAADDDLSITVQGQPEPNTDGGAVTLYGEPSEEDTETYTVVGTLFVNDVKVENWSTRYSGSKGQTFNFDSMVKAAIEKAMSMDPDNKPVNVEAAVYYPGSDEQPASEITYGGEDINWQPQNGNSAYFWVKATTYYQVSFDSDGGSPVASQTVAYNGTATKPDSDPTRDGYTFLGWYIGDNFFEFEETPIIESITLTAKWEKNTTPVPDLHYYVEANFPSRLLIDTNRDVSISIWGDRGVSWQEDATLYVKVDGPARSDADLWYYDSDGWYWGYGKYVDTVREGKIPDALEFNETGVTIPLSLYLDRAGTYDFTFTLKADDGTILATDTATVRAYTETHDDYRIYLDCGSTVPFPPRPLPGPTTRTPSRSMSNPIRAMSWTPCGSTIATRTASASTPTIMTTTSSPCPTPL